MHLNTVMIDVHHLLNALEAKALTEKELMPSEAVTIVLINTGLGTFSKRPRY